MLVGSRTIEYFVLKHPDYGKFKKDKRIRYYDPQEQYRT
jgi:hypothetical protein